MKKSLSWGRFPSFPDDQVRISTGVAHLDELSKGGFLVDKTYLVSGMAGTGKTIFALQFLMANLAEGKNSIYVCLNDRPEHIIFTAGSLGWDIEPAISEGKLQLLDMSPFFSRFALKSGNKFEPKRNEVNIRKIMVELAKYKQSNSAECLVIDSINSFLPDDKASRESIFARELVLLLEEHLDCTSLLTFDRWDGPGEWFVHPIESYVSGVIDLNIGKRADKFNRTLSIKKLRATAAEPA
ncbi:MAG: hypothetical protein KAX16_03215, partial [Actinomycetia bacterium]|nr:hypothetical protein [Actinomycetes bacterium]